jgi:hypothetical protein
MSPSTDTDRSAQCYRPVGEMQSAGDGVACAPVVRFLLSVSHCPLGLGKVQVPSGPTLTVTWGLTRANPNTHKLRRSNDPHSFGNLP